MVLPQAAVLALPNSADDISGVVVASLFAQSALALASWDRKGLALQGAVVVLWSKTMLASHEAESREGLVDFATYITFEEVVVDLRGTFIASRTTFTHDAGLS